MALHFYVWSYPARANTGFTLACYNKVAGEIFRRRTWNIRSTQCDVTENKSLYNIIRTFGQILNLYHCLCNIKRPDQIYYKHPSDIVWMFLLWLHLCEILRNLKLQCGMSVVPLVAVSSYRTKTVDTFICHMPTDELVSDKE